MTRSSFGYEDAYPLGLAPRKRTDWRDSIARFMPPIFPSLMVSLAICAFLVKDYFLLEVISVALCFVAATLWLNENRPHYSWIKSTFTKTTERLTWAAYIVVWGITVATPARATGAGGGSCSATNTILGPIADALIGVFNSSTQVGTTGEIGENICQVFTTFAAIIALLIIGSSLWGLFDNQARGTDLGKAFTPLGLILAGTVISRIGIKLVMGV